MDAEDDVPTTPHRGRKKQARTSPRGTTTSPQKMPKSDYEKQRDRNVAQNQEVFKTCFLDVGERSKKPAPRRKPKPDAKYGIKYLWSDEDISFATHATLFEGRRFYRHPMPYNRLPDLITRMRERGYDSTLWESGVLNTDADQGVHWIVAMWNSAPVVCLWECYPKEFSAMDHVIRFYRANIPGVIINDNYTGIQRGGDVTTCGPNTWHMILIVQQLINAGNPPQNMTTIDPPTPWLVRPRLPFAAHPRQAAARPR